MSAVIEVSELTKSFGDTRAVDRATFSVPAGGIFGFLGPNGAGKTTTIKMLATILLPTSGTIRVDGCDPATQPLEVRRRFGIVFQDQTLDKELTAAENMELHGVLYGVPTAERLRRTEELLKLVDLWARKDEAVKRYSGGMMRRLEIVRALLHEPKILYLDEPTIGLDPQTRANLWDRIKMLSRERGVTVFFTTHYMEEAEKVAGLLAVIDAGKIAAQGTPRELKERTKTATLEEAFIALTGRDVREEKASPRDMFRNMGKLWGG
ncbi:MAG: ATP-binding cassette domain-containing protein [Proteobacteria bacterium]|nr:ATP-binding cassette domain-containing protein [Pseudomonadota bacterium]